MKRRSNASRVNKSFQYSYISPLKRLHAEHSGARPQQLLACCTACTRTIGFSGRTKVQVRTKDGVWRCVEVSERRGRLRVGA